MDRLIRPIEIYNKLLDFMKKEKIDPREMALACKIYESIYEDQSQYYPINFKFSLYNKKFKATVGRLSQLSSHAKEDITD